MLTIEERKKVFSQKRQKIDKGRVIAGFVNTTFEQFEQWFNQSLFEEGCHYCGTTNSQSQKLFTMQRTGLRPDATRGGKRGRRLELDRKDPNRPYDDLDNVVWCCYWCNNAKTNFFTEAEFKPIAFAIGNILKSIE